MKPCPFSRTGEHKLVKLGLHRIGCKLCGLAWRALGQYEVAVVLVQMREDGRLVAERLIGDDVEADPDLRDRPDMDALARSDWSVR